MKRSKNWASGIRTHECRSQSPVPYRLAIAHQLIYEKPAIHRQTFYNIDKGG